MTERFKFRVWDKPLEKYMEFKEFKFMNVEFTFNPITKEAEIEYDKERYIVEQCTGLKDKNGKLIYEGDIVKNGKHIYPVEWYVNGFAVNDGYDYLIDDEKWEIIGNIHENADLIKVGGK